MIKLENLLNRFNSDQGLGGEAKFPTQLTAVSESEKIAEFRARYQSYNLLRKLSPGSVPDEQRSKAFRDFNQLQYKMHNFNNKGIAELLNAPWIEEARHIIYNILPPLEHVEEQLWSLCAYGPGTFNGVKQPIDYTLHYKLGSDQTVTAEAKGLYIQVLRDYYPRLRDILAKGRRLTTVEGNRITHVAKDASKCRSIAVEPSGNVFLQQAVGRYLLQRMRNIGFMDLVHGQSVNRRKAKSLTNGTIDLSSASDTISTELVRLLLPSDWFTLMDTIRSKRWKYRDERGAYANFSSQGNAFTFPLESLIFKAIVMASTGLSARDATVYGDDIIVPVEHAAEVVEALELSGFTVNTEKSYYGQHDDERKYFRESCGADYYREVEVTPYYIRSQPRKLSELAVVYNRFLELWPASKRAISYIVMSIPEERKKQVQIGPRYFITDQPEEFDYRISRGLGLNTIISTYSDWFWNEGPLKGFLTTNGRYMSCSAKIPKKYLLGPDVELAEFLYGGSSVWGRIKTNNRIVRCYVTPIADDMVDLARKGLRAPSWKARYII